MKVLYFDCFSGISGDMTIGALLDAGGSLDVLENELKKLGIADEYGLKSRTVVKNGITATKFDVMLQPSEQSGLAHEHDDEGATVNNHDHHYDHSHAESHHHEHHDQHIHEAGHHHDHDHHHVHEVHHHSHESDHHHHAHRSYKSIVHMINESTLDEKVKEHARRIFAKIAEAEGKIHGIPVDDVHFHEVGAVDSIIDVVGTAILIADLNVEVIYSSPVPVGTGRIRIDHGIYPVPAPATLEMLKGVPIAQSDVRGEQTTPTGAGIVSALAQSFGPIPAMTVSAIGYGAGTKTFEDQPNVLRVIIGEL
jgi:uncharacterized protein (DUF111 family)